MTWVRLLRSERWVREQAVPVVRAVRAGAVRAVLVTTSMWQRGGWDAPVKKPDGSQSVSLLVSGPWNCRFTPRADELAAFISLFHDREDFTTEFDIKAFVIMKCLLKSNVKKSHPPPRAHFPRVPGVFIADRIIVGRYPGIA